MIHLNLLLIASTNYLIFLTFFFAGSCHDILFCAFSLQAAMMFSSGVFWMGLLCIPMTALLLDIVYKV